MRRLIKGLAVMLAAGFVAACGGGGGSAGTPLLGGGEGGSGGGGGGGTTVAAADLTLALSATSLPNNGVDTIKATATAVDANRNAVASIPVTIRVDNGAVATVSGTQTNASGVVTADIGIGSDRSNRAITVTAVSGALSRTATFQVTGAKLTANAVPATLAPGATGEVEFRLLDTNSNPMSGQTILVSGAGGVETQAVTGSSGEFTYRYTAPATTGPFDIRAASGGATIVQTVLVQSSTSNNIPPAAATVRSASVSANPSVVAVNTATTNNRSEVRALFLGSNNAPVKNVRVRFDLAGDPQSIGGSFTSGNNLVYSDSNGVATSAYKPGSRFSPTDGVTIRACWDYNDFAEGACPNQVSTSITVIAEPLSVSIGTNELIESTDQTYTRKYVVQVVDSSGLAKADVQITPSVDLLRYNKGSWQLSFVGTTERWIQSVTAQCDNEDLNRNGVNETYANGAVEDANSSLNLINGRPALEPRKADVAISIVGASRTNSNGQVLLQITYPQNVASWVAYNILVSASGVGGTEGRANFTGVLPVPAEVVNKPDAEPPFRRSPYGVLASPTVFTANPEGQSGMLCTDPN